MTKENWLYAIIGLLGGIVLSCIVYYFTFPGQSGSMHRQMTNSNGMMHDSMMNNMMGSNMQGAMGSMMSGLNGKTGDEFDRAFLSEMTLHHQGAVEMANLALTNSKHQEIKDMARAIIDAQTKEIQQMKNWQQAWYGQ